MSSTFSPLKLRPLCLSDKDSIAAHMNNREVVKNLRDFIPFPYSVEHAVEFIHMNQGIDPPLNLGIEIDGAVVGVIGIRLNDDIHRVSAEIGYWLGQNYWGNGIMTEAVQQMTAYAFNNFSINRIYAGVFETNKPSMRVLEKAGYIHEATLKKSVIKYDVLLDEHIYSILRENFQAY